MYNVTLREGDVVVIHTGWEDLFLQYPKQNALHNSGEAGDRDRGEVARATEDCRVAWTIAWK
jgi:hypothetical protein